jgi:hypothetical protein
MAIVEPGKWYFAVTCMVCEGQLPFMEAPSPEKAPEFRVAPDHLQIRCAACGAERMYLPEQVQRLQGSHIQ